MPPKSAKGKNEPSKKTVEKQKQKVVEDKTFGLKNKKGSKQQKFIQQVEKQVIHSGKSAKEMEKLKAEKEAKKAEKNNQMEELNNLFKPVVSLQKVGAGVDPKSVLCVFYKQGQCSKGAKCKFSHDIAVERKAEKRNIYDSANKEDAMDDWDQEKLEDVVNKKHGEQNKSLPSTTIICKHFLDAVENSKYGWFWECPNGEKCHYKHGLPSGFVLKKDKKKMEEQKEEISLEELIEKERMALGPNQTKVTLESFIAWKKRKKSEKIKALESAKAKRNTDFRSGRMGGISGRELFEFNPDFMQEDEDEEGGDVFDSKLREKDEDDNETSGPVHEIKFDDFIIKENDRLYENGELKTAVNSKRNRENDETLLGACGGGDEPNGFAQNSTEPHNSIPVPDKGGVAIDEDLFNADDLDDLDEDLDNLEIEE